MYIGTYLVTFGVKVILLSEYNTILVSHTEKLAI